MAFFITNLLLGTALAMDAFSLSVADGIYYPDMKDGKRFMIAATYGGFQCIMPIAGWFCVTWIAEVFEVFRGFIPWIALILLLVLGVRMIVETLKDRPNEEESVRNITFLGLMAQGVATSIDALSVGFTIASYDIPHAFAAAQIIGVVTFIICYTGLIIGSMVGMRITRFSGILGGLILIGIGIEIFIRGVI
jgi:putative Mn2+ efflux pump MntP